MRRWVVLVRGKESWDVHAYGPYKTEAKAAQQANAQEAIARRSGMRTVSYHEMHP